MAGQRQPTDLVVMKGKKHLTKAEIEERKNAEVTAPNDKVKPPTYLTAEQKKKFRKLAKELLEIKLIANVDCDALARLLIAQDQYIEITEQIRGTPLMLDVPVYEERENPDTGEKERVQVGTTQVVNNEREKLMIIQDRCMKQCRQGASDFGMTVSSRCRLVVPKPQQQKPENKFAKYAN
ncbi:MAG: phage terminase small subunit P27 family [Clostridiales bacterium]|nr:phage terminase small subunit P27 family [Clostridiales bacterium]